MVKISLCMIVKDEELNLTACLEHISGVVDEVIIVDTGSKDRTKEIARRYTDKVYDYKWNNDFSGARNFSISKADGDYVLILDGDEITESIDMNEIKRLIAANPEKVGRLLRINEYTRKDIPYKQRERVNRLFPRALFRYEGIIHEQVVPVKGDSMNLYNIPLVVRHSGYEGNLDTRKKKTERNIELLKLAAREDPEDPYIIYQLGKSYYMQEDYGEACGYFGQALEFDLNIKLEYVQDLVESYGYSLLNSDQYDLALQLLNIYEDFSSSADFVFLVGLILMNNGRFQEAINEFLKATKRNECRTEGVNSFLSYYNIGVIFECLGDRKKAEQYYKRCGEFEPAVKRLRN